MTKAITLQITDSIYMNDAGGMIRLRAWGYLEPHIDESQGINAYT